MRSWAWTSWLNIRKCTASSPTVLAADQTAHPTAIMPDDLLNERIEEHAVHKRPRHLAETARWGELAGMSQHTQCAYIGIWRGDAAPPSNPCGPRPWSPSFSTSRPPPTGPTTTSSSPCAARRAAGLATGPTPAASSNGPQRGRSQPSRRDSQRSERPRRGGWFTSLVTRQAPPGGSFSRCQKVLFTLPFPARFGTVQPDHLGVPAHTSSLGGLCTRLPK